MLIDEGGGFRLSVLYNLKKNLIYDLYAVKDNNDTR